MNSLDPRFTTIIAAAGAAAAALSPKGAAASAVLSTLLQAATDFHDRVADGSVTDADLAAMLDKAGANLAGLHSDVARQQGG